MRLKGVCSFEGIEKIAYSSRFLIGKSWRTILFVLGSIKLYIFIKLESAC